jgi:hypothetical protein
VIVFWLCVSLWMKMIERGQKKWKRIKSIENVEKEKEWESIHRERVRVCVSDWKRNVYKYL